jgi:hypothetical protein
MVHWTELATEPFDEYPATAEGITIGSTTAEVMAAYPGARAVTVEDPSRGPRDQLVVDGWDDNRYVFDVVGGAVTELSWGDIGPDGIAGELCAL